MKMKAITKILFAGAILLALSPLTHADIKATDFESMGGECIWRGQIRLTPSDCKALHRSQTKFISYLNGLPGKTDDNKMLAMVQRACKERHYRGGVPGEFMGVVQYCSVIDQFYPIRLKVIRSAQGEIWVFKKASRLLYVDSRTGIIKQVVSNR